MTGFSPRYGKLEVTLSRSVVVTVGADVSLTFELAAFRLKSPALDECALKPLMSDAGYARIESLIRLIMTQALLVENTYGYYNLIVIT